MTIIGFTGGRTQPTPEQSRWLRHYMVRDEIKEVHHGACVGADALVHHIAWNLPTVVHPCTLVNHVATECLRPSPRVQVLEPLEPLVRNRAIVDACDRLVVLPDRAECQRSGTWATVRYARSQGKPIVICYRDGRVERG